MSNATVTTTREIIAEDVPNLVPGAEMLGFGFNIFKTYSFDNAIRALFDLGALGTWTSPSGVTFNLPANVTTPGGSSSSASAQSFSTASEFTSYFQRSASISGSIGAFSASFSTSYSSDQQNSQAYSWALVESDVQAWQVSIQFSPQILLSNIQSDPDWMNLPANFDPNNHDNVVAFFRFFQKFGTHFISSVAAGGTLYYYFAVNTSSSYSSEEISMSASAEYHGLISSTSAEASQNWGHTASNWTQNRQSHAVTVPATVGIIDWVNPVDGTYDSNGNFEAWKTAVSNNPSRTKFTLTPIWQIFSGNQWTALQQAFAAYASNQVAVTAYTNALPDSLSVNGLTVSPVNGFPPNPAGWHIVVLDSQTLQPKLNNFYSYANQPNWPDPMNKQICADLGPYAGSKSCILIAVTCGMGEAAGPNEQLYGMLKDFGAGAALDSWFQNETYGCAQGLISYALVGLGASGAGSAIEAITGIVGQPGPSVSLNALLLPLGDTYQPTPFQQ